MNRTQWLAFHRECRVAGQHELLDDGGQVAEYYHGHGWERIRPMSPVMMAVVLLNLAAKYRRGGNTREAGLRVRTAHAWNARRRAGLER